MRVLLLGARGHLGRRVLAGLRAAGHEVAAGTRREPREGEVHADVHVPESLDGFSAIVSCADVLAAPPDAAIARVLGRGGSWIESTAHPPTIERLLGLRSSALPGVLVLGAGLFPGESNVLARQAVEALGGECESVEVAVRIRPMSGAGPALAALMAEMMVTPAVVYRDGVRDEEAPMTRGPDVAFPTVTSASVYASGCEPLMLHASLGVPTTRFLVAPAPAFAARMLRFLAPWMPTALLRLRPVRWVNTLYLTLLRAVFFRWRAAPIEIVATARARDGRTEIRSLRVEDGMVATADAIVATLAHVLRSPPAPGVHLPDDLGYAPPPWRTPATISAIQPAISASPPRGVTIPRARGAPRAIE